MSNRFIQYGFTAGIVTEALWSQTILQKYGYGLAECKNYLITKLGGLVTRGGFAAGTLAPASVDDPFRFVPFNFAKNTSNTFGIFVVADAIYFMQGGAWQLEDGTDVTEVASTSTETTVTSTAHGLSVGDFVEFTGDAVPAALFGQTVVVSAVNSADEVEVTQIDLAAGMDSWTDATLTGGAKIRALYKVASPYDAGDLPDLYFRQSRDEIKIFHKEYYPRSLIRESDGTWSLTTIDNDVAISRPTTIAGVIGGGGNGGGGVLFGVAAVDENGEEGIPLLLLHNGIALYTANGTLTYELSWGLVTGATEYYVYRSIVTGQKALTKGEALGYITKTRGTSIADEAYVPDFTKSPVRVQRPFTPGRVKRIDITAVGSAYDINDTVSVSGGGGSGFIGNLIVHPTTGAVQGIEVLDPGEGYSSATVSITTSTGSGFTGTVVLEEDAGTFPTTGANVKQRAFYAATLNETLRIWASRLGLLNNMGYDETVGADDGFSYQVDSELYGTIRHILDSPAGGLIFTDVGIWLMTGTNGVATATDIQLDPQSSVGCNNLLPIALDNDLVYMEQYNQAIRLLQFNDYSKNYGGRDISILAGELISAGTPCVNWGNVTFPYNYITVSRTDGNLLVGTVDREQEVFAWYYHDTAGEFLSNVVLFEDERQVEYVVVKRYLSDRWVLTIEYATNRFVSTREDHCGLDCSVPFGYTYGTGTLSFDGSTITSTANDFTSGNVGDTIRYKELKLVITDYNSATSVDVDIIDDKSDLYIEELATYKPIPAGEWLLSPDVSSITLPLNFRPAQVTVYGDGNTETAVTVGANGLVTFSQDYSLGWVGLSFSCVAKTLPLQVQGALIEASVKNINQAGLRFYKSKAIEVGTELDHLYPIQEYLHTVDGESAPLKSDYELVAVRSDWEYSVGLYIVVTNPAPAHITGVIIEAEIGDAV